VSANSWGHTLQRLSADETARMLHADACDCGCRRRRLCTIGRRDHQEPATHLATYQYVTGRAGRVSWARRYMCDVHAEKFRVKHDLAVPEVRPTSRHALERILDGGAS
jgi:hypothetical protein